MQHMRSARAPAPSLNDAYTQVTMLRSDRQLQLLREEGACLGSPEMVMNHGGEFEKASKIKAPLS